MTRVREGGTRRAARLGRTVRLGCAAAGLTLLLATGAGCGLAGLGEDPADERAGGGDGDWRQQAAAIEGIADYHETDPGILEPSHVEGAVTYEVVPPVGGPHHQAWQNCSGDIYTTPIADENAVHSLEHGAVWITYHPSLPADHVAALEDRVRGNDKVFMSPYPNLTVPISLQAWGYQLPVDGADDPRIDEFIRVLRVNPAPEPHAPCTGGLPAPAG